MILAQWLESGLLVRDWWAKGFFHPAPLTLGRWSQQVVRCQTTQLSFSSPTKFWKSSILTSLPPAQRKKHPSSPPGHTHHFCPWYDHAECGFMYRIMHLSPWLSPLHTLVHKYPFTQLFRSKKWDIIWVVAACTSDPTFPSLCLRCSRGQSHGKEKKKKETWEIHSLTVHFSKFQLRPQSACMDLIFRVLLASFSKVSSSTEAGHFSYFTSCGGLFLYLLSKSPLFLKHPSLHPDPLPQFHPAVPFFFLFISPDSLKMYFPMWT